MSPVELTIDRAHVKQNECWRRCSAPLTTLVVVRAETLIQQRIRCRNADIQVQFDSSTSALTLRGVVGSYYHKQLAQEAVRHLERVSHVNNLLDVRELASRPHVGGDRETPATRETDGESS